MVIVPGERVRRHARRRIVSPNTAPMSPPLSFVYDPVNVGLTLVVKQKIAYAVTQVWVKRVIASFWTPNIDRIVGAPIVFWMVIIGVHPTVVVIYQVPGPLLYLGTPRISGRMPVLVATASPRGYVGPWP
jgi:hypothetical protein